MKLNGQLSTPDIHTYYVTGSLEQKTENEPLQKMLKKIKDGGINTFLNDKDLKNFAYGLIESFKQDRYINADGSLTQVGEEIIETGKSWRGLRGAFLFTVLSYNECAYLLDAELVKEFEKDSDKNALFDDPVPKQEFQDSEYVGIGGKSFRKIQTDANWAYWSKQPKGISVKFEFDYENNECTVTATFDNKKCTFTTKESNNFSIMKRADAHQLLEEYENEDSALIYEPMDTKSVKICVPAAQNIADKPWLEHFFENGYFSLPIHEKDIVGEINDIHLYIAGDDNTTAEILLNEYLLRKAESTYLGYEETGRLVNTFQELFVSQDESTAACPPIMKGTKAVYGGLVQRAKAIAETEKRPNAYLHLLAYIDLAPANTLKPYIENKGTMNLTNQEVSFDDFVDKIFGEERNITAISALSKYTASNGRNARAFMLLAKSITQKFGQKLTLITTDETVNSLPAYRDSDKKWFGKIKACEDIHLVLKKRDEVKDVHDRYFKVTRSDGSVEWHVMTGELDALRFDKDSPHIREDIYRDEKGTVKEMTVSKIKQDGVPDKVVKIMEEK